MLTDTGECKELMYALLLFKVESKWFLSLKEWLLNVHGHKKIQGKLSQIIKVPNLSRKPAYLAFFLDYPYTT